MPRHRLEIMMCKKTYDRMVKTRSLKDTIIIAETAQPTSCPTLKLPPLMLGGNQGSVVASGCPRNLPETSTTMPNTRTTAAAR